MRFMAFSREKQRLLVIAALLLWPILLILWRLHLASDLLAVGLLWNLFLAFVPLCWSAAFEKAMALKRMGVAAIYFGLWLLFFPNAPYLLTDLIHLRPSPNVPLWFLMAMLLSCAGSGTLLGYFSLSNVQNTVARTWGTRIGWSVAMLSLLLCGFGIYLGRFLRWNSWDALTQPLQLMRVVAQQCMDSGQHPHPLTVTFVFGCGLLIGYVALKCFSAHDLAINS
jgi:uncharacterized membrane protein